MFESECQEVVTVSTSGTNNTQTKPFESDSRKIHSITIPSATVGQHSLTTEDIVKLCNSIADSDKGTDDGSKIVYIVQTDGSNNSKVNLDDDMCTNTTADVKRHLAETPRKVANLRCKRSYDEDVQEFAPKRFSGDTEFNKHRGFFIEITERFETMTQRQQALAKMRVMQLLYEFQYGSVEDNKTTCFLPPSSTPKTKLNNNFPKKAYTYNTRQSQVNEGNSKMTRSGVQIKVNNFEYSLVDVSMQSNCKSEVWQKFQRVYDGKSSLDFVACKDCKLVYPHTRFAGTSGLRKHSCPSKSPKKSVGNNNKDSNFDHEDYTVEDVTIEEDISTDNDTVIGNKKNNDKRAYHHQSLPQEQLSKVEVTRMIANGELTVRDETDNPRPRFKSPIWEDFYRVYDGEIPREFVTCKQCGAVYPYSGKTGTTGIKKHNCSTYRYR